MSPGGTALCALAILMIANRLVLKHALTGPWSRLYWVVQACNLASIAYLVAAGLPGLPRETRVMDWVVALLFLWHIAENHLRRSTLRSTAEFRALLRGEERRAAEIAAQRDRPTEPGGEPPPASGLPPPAA